MSRHVAIFAVFLFLVILALWIFSDLPDKSDYEHPGDSQGRPNGSEKLDDKKRPIPSIKSKTSNRKSIVTTGKPLSVNQSLTPKFPHALPGPVLKIVQGRTGAPIPHAEVTLLDLSPFDTMTIERGNHDAYLQRYGLRYRCDADGSVGFPWHIGQWVAESLHENLRNRGVFSVIGNTECTLPLYPIDTHLPLRIQVVDTEGNPKPGVGVIVKNVEAVQKSIVTRKPDGLACFYLLQSAVVASQENEGILVTLDLFSGPGSRRILHRWTGKAEKLVLPESGAITVKVLEPDGKPWNRPGHVEIVWLGENGWSCRYFSILDGSVHLPYVGLGSSYRAKALLPSNQQACNTIQFSGPSVPGETVIQTLTIGKKETVLVGRGFGPDGDLLRYPVKFEAELLNEVDDVLFRNLPCTIHPGHDGRFMIVLRALMYRKLKIRLLREGRVCAYGAISLKGKYEPGIYNVGDVYLNSSHCLASGVIVDDRGHKVPGASVFVYLNSIKENNPLGIIQGSSGVVSTNPEGRFAIWWSSFSGKLDIRVTCKNHRETIKKGIVSGSQDHRIEIQRLGALVGSVLLDPRIDTSLLKIAAVSSQNQRPQIQRIVEENGDFKLDGLFGDMVDVVVRSDEQSLFHIQNVIVTPGKVRRDPRLQRIDLRSLIHVVTIRVVNREGKPIQNAVVDVFNQLKSSKLTGDNGSVSLSYIGPSFKAVVHKHGYRMVEVNGVDSDRAIVMEPGLPIRIRLDTPLVLPPDLKGVLIVRYRSRIGKKDLPVIPSHTFAQLNPEDGFVDMNLEAPGIYSVTLKIWYTEVCEPHTILIPDTPERRIFTIRILTDRVAEAIQKWNVRE